MTTLVNDIALVWWGWMGPMFWQASLLVVIVGVIDLAIRNWVWPQVRRALWLLVLIKLMVPPTLNLPTGVVPQFQPAAERTIVEQLQRLRPAPTPTLTGAVESEPSRISEVREEMTADARSGIVWQAWAFGAWLAGMIVFAVLLQTRLARLRRWHREQEERRTIPEWFHELLVGTAERLKMGELPAIVFSDEVESPAVYGVLNPVLLLPAEYLSSLSREEAEHVLLHEMAHLKRGDLRWHGLTLALQIIYWFNPFLIWARRQLKHVGEICCDMTVAETLREDTGGYRQTLLKTARRLLTESPDPGLGLLGVFEDPFRLVARIRWLEKESWRHREAIVVSVLAVLLVAVPVLLPMAAPADLGFGGSPDDVFASGQAVEREFADYDDGKCWHLEEVSRYERRVLGFRVEKRVTGINDLWVGDGVLAYNVYGRTIVADLSRDRLLVIDHSSGTYFEGTLPADTPAVIAEDERDRWQRRRSDGRVTSTDSYRKVLGYKCRRYDVKWWKMETPAEVAEFSVWTSDEVPFDTRPFEAAMKSVRNILNRSPEYQRQLEVMQGIQLRIAMKVGNGFSTRIFVDETEHMELETPPPGIFEPPADYEQVDAISGMWN